MKAILLCLTLLSFLYSTASQGTTAPTTQLVIQISENSIDKVDYALNSARFLQEHYGKNGIDILIVAYGEGVRPFNVFTPMPIANKIKKITQQGVRIALCEQAMRRRNMRPSDMHPKVDFVRSGVVEIIEKRKLGWVYIRP